MKSARRRKKRQRLKPARSVEANVRRFAPRLFRRYFRRGRRVATLYAGVPELHRFRIRTKRLRYISELYQRLFPRALTRAVVELKGIQDVLGALQDHATVAAYFERRLVSVRNAARQAEYVRVLHRARVRQEACRRQFLQRWRRLERTRFRDRILNAIE